jgi:hypothetical protein
MWSWLPIRAAEEPDSRLWRFECESHEDFDWARNAGGKPIALAMFPSTDGSPIVRTEDARELVGR